MASIVVPKAEPQRTIITDGSLMPGGFRRKLCCLPATRLMSTHHAKNHWPGNTSRGIRDAVSRRSVRTLEPTL